jgi:hypothetical protein
MSQYNNWESAIKDYLNNDFEGETGDGLPLSVQKAVERMVQMENNNVAGVSAKTQVGGVVTYSYTADEIPKSVKQTINRYRKVAI